ncbi:PIN domain-containing protein [Candidatus Woesearchaeota archaeon]|nr:PIN domain-containing protein [Candidatus Woesearchaeota archaeon]
MRLVLDTNILIASLIKDSVTREILTHPEIEYLVPEFALQEIEANKDEIIQKSRLSKERFQLLLAELKNNILIVPETDIGHRKEAELIISAIDPEDSIFIALALSIRNDGIWSEDKHFEKQNIIKVWKTKDLVKHLGITHRPSTYSNQQ